MPPLVWLAVALVAGVAAVLVGWPAWRSSRARESRDLNTERYRAWRGQSVRGQPASTPDRMTADERRRIYGGAALGALAVVALLAFFLTT